MSRKFRIDFGGYNLDFVSMKVNDRSQVEPKTQTKTQTKVQEIEKLTQTVDHPCIKTLQSRSYMIRRFWKRNSMLILRTNNRIKNYLGLL